MATIHRFGDLRLDTGRYTVERDGHPIKLPKLSFQLLVALVRAAPNVLTHDEIAAQVWSGRNVSPETLTQRIKVLRDALGDNPNDPRYILGVRGQGYRLIPEVDAEESASQRAPPGELQVGTTSDSERRQSTQRVRRVVAAASALTLALLATLWMAQHADPNVESEKAERQGASEIGIDNAAEKSIVVLPFSDFSQNRDHEWFCDGISDEILNLLVKVPGLRVISRTSAFAFKGRTTTTREIADILNVIYVLEGSVRVIGDEFRITVQLVDSRTEAHIWSKVYPGTTSDVFAIQREIAGDVAARLRVTLDNSAHAIDTTTPKVYELFLRARHINRSPIVSNLAEAERMLKEAIRLDPTYFPARLELTKTYFHMHALGESLDPREAERLSRKTLAEAAQMWPHRPEVNASLGFHALRFDQNFETAALFFERALAADPTNFETLRVAIPFSIALNRPIQAIDITEYVLARDPACMWCSHRLLEANLLARRYDEVEEAYKAARMMNRNGFSAEAYYARSLLLRGEPEAALQHFGLLESKPDHYVRDGKAVRLTGSAMALHDLRRNSEFETAFAMLREHAEDRYPMLIAEVHAYTGDLDSAFEILSAQPSLPIETFDGWLGDRMRNHRDWLVLAEKAGIWPEDPRDHIDFDVRLY